MKLLALVLASSALALVVYAKSLDRFEEHHIVPDLINAPPKDELKIKYSSGAEVKYGNILTPTMVKELPKKLEWDYDSKSLTTLIMIDPDAPSRRDPFRGEVLHWLVVNIPKGDFKKGDTLVEYIGSGPPNGTGLHRYITLVFKQPNKFENSTLITLPRASNRSFANRPHFKIRQFTSKHNLTMPPVAGNFFQARFDDYVPVLHAQLMGNSSSPVATPIR